MKTSNIYIALFSLACMLPSCELYELNPNEIGLESAISDPEKARYILNGCYDALQGTYLYKGGQETNGIRDHDAISDCGYNNWSTGLREIANGGHNASHSMIEGFWEQNYNGIACCNLFIDSFGESDIDNIDQYLAEAKTLRALYYFHLTNYYGNVPLVLHTLEREEAYYVTRTPRAETLDSITSDLEWAVDYLQYRQDQSSSDVYQVSKGAALGLLVRINLFRASRLDWTNMDSFVWETYTGETTDATLAAQYYTKAKEYAARLMTSEFDYELQADFSNLFDGTNENGIESIFEVQFESGLGEGEAFSGTYAVNPQPWIVPTAEMVATYLQTNGEEISTTPSADVLETSMDPRFYTTVLFTGQTWVGSLWTGSGINYGPDPYMKFATRKYVRTETGYFADGDRNFMVIRYADILLMYAEAKLKLGEIDSDMFDALDQVRNRVGMPLWDRTETNSTTLMTELQKERLREFGLEGMRYQDMIRWGIYSELASRASTCGYNSDFDYKRYLFPVPQTECDNNRSEEGLQNEGWK